MVGQQSNLQIGVRVNMYEKCPMMCLSFRCLQTTPVERLLCTNSSMYLCFTYNKIGQFYFLYQLHCDLGWKRQ